MYDLRTETMTRPHLDHAVNEASKTDNTVIIGVDQLTDMIAYTHYDEPKDFLIWGRQYLTSMYKGTTFFIAIN